MTYSVYIPAYNAAPFLDRCLRAVLAQTVPPQEIVVVDDGSTDTTAAIARQYPVTLIRHPRNLGLAAARNTGWRSCRTGIIGAIDADCCPTPGWAAALLPHFADPRIAGVGGRLLEVVQQTAADHWRLAHMQQQWSDERTVLRNPLLLSGNNTLFRAEALRQCDGYDESPRFLTNNEDLYICERLKAGGNDILHDPAAVVHHLRQDTFTSIFRTYWKWFEHHNVPLNSIRNLAAKQYQTLLRCREFLLASRRRRDFDTMPFDILFVLYQVWFDLRTYVVRTLAPAAQHALFRAACRLYPLLPPAWWFPVLPASRHYNALLARVAQRRHAARVKSLPVKVTIDSTHRCNLHCAMCFRQHDGFSFVLGNGRADTDMPLALFRRLAGETLPLAKTMCLTVYGEPLLTPWLPEVVSACRQHGVRLELISNFALPLTAAKLEPLLEITSDLRISIDAATAATYERIRRGARWEQLLRNIALLNELRCGGRYPHLRVGIFMVVMRENVAELPLLVRHARSWGFDYLHASHLALDAAYERNHGLAAVRGEAEQVFAQTRELGKRLALNISLPPLEPAAPVAATLPSPAGRECPYLYHELFISQQGDLRPCCQAGLPPFARIGSGTLPQLWNTSAIRTLRRRFNTTAAAQHCRCCWLIDHGR